MQSFELSEEQYKLLVEKWGTIPTWTKKPLVTTGQLNAIHLGYNRYSNLMDEMFSMFNHFILKTFISESPVMEHQLPKRIAQWILDNAYFFYKHGKSRHIKETQKSIKKVLGIKSKTVDKPKTSYKLDYYEYIVSPEWIEKSKQAKIRAGNRCQICNRSSRQVILHTHHRTYERLGNEKDSDLTVLCVDCHKLYEDNKKLKKIK
jgi:hypothetical protein